jgi:plastocyanin
VRVPIVLVSTALVLGAPLAGCGDDGGTASGASSTSAGRDRVEVVAHDIGFGADRYQATAGTLEVSYRNDGAIPHSLRIDGVDSFRLEVASKGDEDQASVELEPGTYTIYCDIPGHRQAGMEATLEVR